MKKTFKVVMLPTNKKSNIYISGFSPLLLYTEVSYEDGMAKGKNQHLYILSDEQPKDGDWYLRLIDNTITKANINSDHKHYECKKIVATTDKSIRPVCIKCNTRYGQGNHDCKYPCDHNGNLYFPQLPASFIQAYIKAYNEGNPITEVDLEIELHKWVGSTYPVGHRPTYQIKTRPDNTVIVHQSKMYSRDEVIKLIEKFDDSIPHDTDVDKWIQDNL